MYWCSESAISYTIIERQYMAHSEWFRTITIICLKKFYQIGLCFNEIEYKMSS